MVDWETVALSAVVAIIVASIGPYLTHKLSVRYLKKEFIFKEKIAIFEKITGLSGRIHLIVTELELKTKNKEILKQELKQINSSFMFLFDKMMYIHKDLMKFLGKYIDLFERYSESKEFGTEESIKDLREKVKPLADEVSKIIQREYNKIN